MTLSEVLKDDLNLRKPRGRHAQAYGDSVRRPWNIRSKH